MIRIAWTAALLVLACLSACSSAPTRTPEREYTLVFLRSGPSTGKLSEALNRQAFIGHFANMQRLAGERKLVVAGPFGATRHATDLRGLFVLDTANEAQAKAWAETDPAAQAGVFVLEYHALATGAPLREALERDLKREERALAEGLKLAPGSGARTYVLLTAEDHLRAERELWQMTATEGVYLLARLDGERSFALLDAANVAEAKNRFSALLERLGPHTLDDWFASDHLAQMGAESPKDPR